VIPLSLVPVPYLHVPWKNNALHISGAATPLARFFPSTFFVQEGFLAHGLLAH
jgi:hypothetical protein